MTTNESPSLSQLLAHTNKAHMELTGLEEYFYNHFRPIANRALESHASLEMLGAYELFVEPLHIEVRKITTDMYNISLQVKYTRGANTYTEPIAVLQYIKQDNTYEYKGCDPNVTDASLIISQRFPSEQDFYDCLDSLIAKFK